MLSAQPPQGFADDFGGEDREGEKHGNEKLSECQGGSAENTAAKVNESDLDDQDGKHDQQKDWIFAKPCGQFETVGA